MFGILRPHRGLLGHRDRVRHTSAYCNLCGLLGSQYGLTSRMLVVHDIATLWWLLEDPIAAGERPLATANCLRGGARRLRRHGLTEQQRLLAALSAYTVGVKVADDIADGGRWQSRAVDRVYHRAFEQARRELLALDIDVGQLEKILRRQDELERAREPDFVTASQPTAEAYGFVAREIAQRCECLFSADQAREAGEALGRAVYLVDAIRDFQDDRGASYNPLCLAVPPDHRELPPALRHKVLTFVGSHLVRGREISASVASYLERCWYSVERTLFSATGVHDHKSVTLYSGCCIPCGDGAVYVDKKDCEGAGLGCCCLCCLVVRACNNGCS